MRHTSGGDVYAIPTKAIQYWSIDIVVQEKSIENIPKSEGIILVSEHPTDIIDYIIIMHTLGSVRHDYKLTANSHAFKLKLLNSILFSLSVHGEKNTAVTNAASIRNTIKWLKEKHALITFPGARPSTLSQGVRHGREHWSALPLLLAEKTGAVILPVQLKLAEPQWHLFLKKHFRPVYNLLIFHILKSLNNTQAFIAIGAPIRLDDLPQELTREQQAQWLRKQAASL